jgi:hypothetical protein
MSLVVFLIGVIMFIGSVFDLDFMNIFRGYRSGFPFGKAYARILYIIVGLGFIYFGIKLFFE